MNEVRNRNQRTIEKRMMDDGINQPENINPDTVQEEPNVKKILKMTPTS